MNITEFKERKEKLDNNPEVICSECGSKNDDVILRDMGNHPLYDGDGDIIPLCDKCYEDIWDQVGID